MSTDDDLYATELVDCIARHISESHTATYTRCQPIESITTFI